MQKDRSFRRRVFDIIQIGNRNDLPSRAFDIVLSVIIILNIVTMILDTFEELSAFREFFEAVEIVAVVFFCIEYLLRIWTADYLYPEEGRLSSVLHFLRSFDGVIDLLTILPFFFLSGFGVFRMLRVVRIFHLFRINNQYDSFVVIKHVILEKKNQLASSLFIILILMVAASLFMYSAEHEAQPGAFKNAFSGIWWSVSTLLTVGYGDLYPVTVTGQILAIIIAFLGVGAVAIPTGIISAGFVEQYTKAQMSEPELTARLAVIQVQQDSAWIGRSVQEIEEEFHVDVVLVEREKRTFRPQDSYRVRLGDSIAYLP